MQKQSILNLKVNLTKPKRINLNLEMKFTPNKASKGFKIWPYLLSNLAFLQPHQSHQSLQKR